MRLPNYDIWKTTPDEVSATEDRVNFLTFSEKILALKEASETEYEEFVNKTAYKYTLTPNPFADFEDIELDFKSNLIKLNQTTLSIIEEGLTEKLVYLWGLYE